MDHNMHFSAFHLDAQSAPEAFPLIRIAMPGLEQRRWIEHCDTVVHQGGGVLGAFAGDRALHGIAAYWPDADLRLGRVLRVDPLVTFELGPTSQVRLTLCRAIELLCRGLGARGMVVTAPSRGLDGGESLKLEEWARAGLSLDSIQYRKTLQAVVPKAADQFRLT